MKIFFVLGMCFGFCSSQVNFPHGHDLKVYVDQGFAYLDANHDGFISSAEMTFVIDLEDGNHDHTLTLAEFLEFTKFPPEVGTPIFNAYDKDLDGMIPANYYTTQGYMNAMDTDGDGQVNLHEYEHYMIGFYNCVFGHGNHGHGHGCDQ